MGGSSEKCNASCEICEKDKFMDVRILMCN